MQSIHNILHAAQEPPFLGFQQATFLHLNLPSSQTRGAEVQKKTPALLCWVHGEGSELREGGRISPKMSHQRQEHIKHFSAIRHQFPSVNQTSIRQPSADTLKPWVDTHKHVYTVSRLTLSGQSALVSLPLISSPALTWWEAQHIIQWDFHSFAQGVNNEAGKQQQMWGEGKETIMYGVKENVKRVWPICLFFFLLGLRCLLVRSSILNHKLKLWFWNRMP